MIELVRIDDRLVHGQVVTGWTKTKGINMILAVDDKVAKDSFQCQLMKMATPPGVISHFLTTKEAIERIKSGKYDQKKCLLLAKTAQTLFELCSAELGISEVNVGNMRNKDAKNELHNIVYLTDSDLEIFKKIDALGIKLIVQSVPNEKPVSLNDVLKKY